MFQVPLVLIQATSKSEAFFTFRTGKGFRARMGRQVSCQVVVPRKSFVAQLALERALTSVQQLMNLQGAPYRGKKKFLVSMFLKSN